MIPGLLYPLLPDFFPHNFIITIFLRQALCGLIVVFILLCRDTQHSLIIMIHFIVHIEAYSEPLNVVKWLP